ncbi:MAG: ABC transporter permease, partial [Firmicutes bacterium]|nr:ABC transporter permease [Bacillota bacterium]
MKARAVKAIMRKDITAISSNIQIWLPMIFVPLIFSIVLPCILILPARFSALSKVGNIEPILDLLSNLPPGVLREKVLSLNTTEQQLIFFSVNYLFAPLFLLIPLMSASVIGANSFAGEKERKTMESLLFAPLDLPSLFGAKILAAFLPALLLTILCSLFYGIIVNVVAYPLFREVIFPQGNWLVLLFWVTPALSLGAILINVFISAKVKGFQEAYQLGGLVILPLLALIIGQITGLLLV